MMEKQFLATFLEDLDHKRVVLPTLPEVAMQVRKLVNNPKATARQIARMIATDPALTARLLRVVNSPVFRGREHIENVHAAVARLGATQLRNIITTLVMQQLYQAKGPAHIHKRLKQLWSHSAKVAALSFVIAKKFTRLQPDQAMLGGLIHDIGALPVLQRAGALPQLAADPTALDELIKHLHILIGPFILEEWGFSPELVAVCAQHEDLWRTDPEITYIDVVIIANLHCHLGSSHRLAKMEWGDIPAFTKLGLTPAESIATLEGARDELQEVRKLFAP